MNVFQNLCGEHSEHSEHITLHFLFFMPEKVVRSVGLFVFTTRMSCQEKRLEHAQKKFRMADRSNFSVERELQK
jgi:hypothetical protein